MSKRELGTISATDVDLDAPRAKRRKDVPAANPPKQDVPMADVKHTANGEQAQIGAIDGAKDENVKEPGLQLWQTIKDAVNKEGRTLSHDFMRLPSRRQYPDYYVQIKKPISLEEIRTELQTGAYHSLDDVKQDLETCFANAKRYNMKESQIWKDAKILHLLIFAAQKLVKKEYTKMTGVHEEDGAEAGDNADAGGEASDNEGDKKKSKNKVPNMNRLLKGRLQKLVDKTDDSGRVLSEEFMELPSKKLWPTYYKTIKRPQCIENIFKHLKRKEYHNSAEFANDVELVFANALTFNQDHTPIWEDARVLQDYFRQLMSDLPRPYALPDYTVPPKDVPAQSSGKIKLKMPPTPQSTITSSAPVDTSQQSSTLLLRLPGVHVPPNATAGPSHSTKRTMAKSPVMSPLMPPPPLPIASSYVPTPHNHPTSNPTPGPSSGPTAQPSPYSFHYPNAAYQQTNAATPGEPAPAAAVPALTGPPAGSVTRPSITTHSLSHSPAPSSSQPRRQLRYVLLTTNPLGRRLELDHRDGVKSWAVRLTSGERAVRVGDVSILEEEREESSEDDQADDREQEEVSKTSKGKGKAKGRKKESDTKMPKAKGNGRTPLHDVVLRLDGTSIKVVPDRVAEWQVELPVGSSTLEVGEKGGVIWKVFFDRLPV